MSVVDKRKTFSKEPTALSVSQKVSNPAAPRPVHGLVCFVNDGALWCRWDQSGPASSFRVTVTPGNQSFYVSGCATEIIGLANGTAYTVSVEAELAGRFAAKVSRTTTPVAGPTGLASVRGLACWLAADKLVLSNGANVAPWADSSGNGNLATTPVALRPSGSFAPAAPTFMANWTNGKPAVAGSGTQGLGLPVDFTTDRLGSEATVFVVCDVTSAQNPASSYQQVLLSNSGYLAAPSLDDQRAMSIDTKGVGNTNAWRTSNAHAPAPLGALSLNTPTILSVEFPAPLRQGFEYVNGAKVAGQPVMSLVRSMNRFGLFTSPNSGLNLQGRIAEVLIYARHLPQAERWLVETYLSTKYAIGVVQQ